MSKKFKQKTFAKPLPLLNTNIESTTDIVQFETELTWCVHQLENSLYNNAKKLNPRLAEETAKNIKILKNPGAPLVRKRQIMKQSLGDYRAKMKEEEKKLALMAKQIKFMENIESSKKHSFVKKSALLSSGKDFRFNFDSSDVSGKEAETTENTAETATTANVSKQNLHRKLNLTSGQGFRFNFHVDQNNEEINLEGLSLATN